MQRRAHGAVAAALLGMLTACADPTQRARAYAYDHGMTASVIQGTSFRHQTWTARTAPIERTASEPGASLNEAVLYVFIEGDGSPWIDAGSKVAQDPTPRRPLALELAAATGAAPTPHAVLYLGRPCYYEPHRDGNCTPDLWTSGRYSAAVVESLVAAVNRYTAAHEPLEANEALASEALASDAAAAAREPALVLIGYSGGGTLAVLMAAHLPGTLAVVTIAANLDIAAWTRWHHYLPLSASENPATEPPLPGSIRQWHLVGGQDENVPEVLERRYFDTLRPDQVWRYADFDHACCWAKRWDSILARIDAAIAER